ncbi:cyanophycin synthetase [Chryseobacterium indologenes]|uniref:cyanophycin synthetase n=1 Tax=Chryseobacterium indologenes TaxID=253 RepID=UPI000F510699|nr:cyanophycin synthetase [Chryseobacterium indologenes]AYZ35502.1 cyanophycin synthetase [Chryseobacterium indologenes]MBF6644257.1 cyanophycin synthetase [Chryseobacterium indologenes]MBU3049355.1 cyanophycin synthetase [Chryseobacterium indologenes]MEB4759857.1 cyanophycin synthetase [Chryseobacterium indologenes]QQQ72031.1 cyanophycin synthetase [Chryseobacterium indologenes]
MKIEKIQALRGPNIWSIRRKKLIQMRLDLEEMENYPTNKIEGFRERIEKLIPSLITHRCSEGVEGGFFHRVETGTWMGHVIEHIALEIQTLAGMDVGFGRTRETKTPGVYNVVFNYIEENAGIYAAEEAVKIAEALIEGTDYDLSACIHRLKEIRERVRLGPSTGSIVEEAASRKIPWIRLGTNSLVQLGYGVNQQRFQATITGKTSSIAVDIACNKELTKKMLHDAAIPVPIGDMVVDEEGLESVIRKIGYPIVLKPLDGNHGKGSSINVNDWEAAKTGLEHAQKYSRKVIVEKYITGYDFRVLVIDNKMVAASRRVPAHIVGDGELNIQQLIDKENKDPRRGYGHENVLTEIEVDKDTLELLDKLQYTLDTVPQRGEVVYLKSTANLSTGGTSIDVTDMVHPENITMAERISKIIGLDVCGIDIMAENLTQPLKESGGAIIEVNAAPGFRMHLAPSEGLPRNVAAPVVDMLYPQGRPFTIPIIAVTGTNGKTTTTRLISHIVKSNGYRVGFTTSDGIYIQNTMLSKGDTTGPLSAEFILKDPTVEFAVLETARGGILRSGLGFSQCDIGVLTNIEEDHLGMNDIHSLKDLTKVKRVVLDSVKKNGWSVLNADNEYSMKIVNDLDCNVAIFSMDENNPHIVKFAKEGKITCVFEEGFVTIKKGDWKIRIGKAKDFPIAMEGKARFMIENVLAASLASYLHGFGIEDISNSLRTFIPSAQLTPGRLNVFKFKNFKVLIDFAHNPSGYEAIEDYLKNVESSKKIGIISGVGDRRDNDIRECGRIAGRMFDHIIIRNEKHLRGRTEEEINGLIIEGMQSSGKDVSYEIIPKEIEALKHAIGMAEEGTFITALSDVISNAIDLVQEYQARELLEDDKNL